MSNGPQNHVGHEPAPAEREVMLAALLEELVAEQRRGKAPSPGELVRRHGELGRELAELWQAAQLVEQMGQFELSHSQVTDGANDQGELTAPHLPDPVRRNVGTALPPSESLPSSLADYELLAELGRGGMGIVYKALQKSLDRPVALKMMLAGGRASAADRARFRGEAESAARLDHPSIVPVYEVGQWEDQPYFTMKFVEGSTLNERLAKGPLPPREAAALLAEVARAVDFAHRQGILHRDLKPSNILLDREGRPLVTDFGLAKRVESGADLTRTGAIVGTPAYMAPEQAAGRRGQLGPATDVYALGSILYHMLTGRAPFQAANAVDTVLLLLEQDPLPPRQLNRQVDRALEQIALRCLQKPPDLRYPSAAALAADLDAYLAGEPVSARSGLLFDIVTRLFRETHHAPVLENWGLLWMWHSLVLLVMCLVTNYMQWRGVQRPAPYLAFWLVGLGIWAAIFWSLRRRAGPVTFVERQIAHIWGASIITNAMLYVIEMIMHLPVLTLSPVLGLTGGAVFLMKAAILSGEFYIYAAASFLTALAMAVWPSVGLTIFGVVSSLSFFLPGWKYFRQRKRFERMQEA